MLDTLNDICADYGLTPVGIRHALDQYKKVIYELTNGRLSKLTYNGNFIISEAEDCFKKDYEEDNGWISVKDRLPDREITVLAIKQLKNGNRDYCLARCIPDWSYTDFATGKTCTGPYWICGGNNNVIYWMPLPDMPEDDHDQQ